MPPASSALEGVSLHAIGHSYLAADFDDRNPAQRYPWRVANRLGMNLVLRATYGYRMQDAALDVIGNLDRNRTWRRGAPGVVLVDATTNDWLWNGAAPAALRGYEHSLRSLLGYVSLQAAPFFGADHPAIARQGGARLLWNNDFAGAQLATMSGGQSGGLVFRFDVPVVFGMAGLSGPAGRFEIVVDNTVRQVVDIGGQCALTTVSGTARPWTPTYFEVDAPGTPHWLTIRPEGGRAASGEGPFLNYIGVASPTPPAILVMRSLPLATATYNGFAGRPSNEVVAQYNAIIDRVVAEFSHARVVDASPGWDTAGMLGSDRVHPNAAGNAHIADAVEAALLELPFSWGVTR